MTALPEYRACELCPQTRTCQFCDFEALKATVEGRPWPSKYVYTAEGYKLVISFEKDNVPPNPVKGKMVQLQFGVTDSEQAKQQRLDVLSAFIKSGAEMTTEVKEWLAGMLSSQSDSLCQLGISFRTTGAPSKHDIIRHHTAVQEYERLRASGVMEIKAKEVVVKGYDLTQRQLNEAILAYGDKVKEKSGILPAKRRRGRPKKYQ